MDAAPAPRESTTTFADPWLRVRSEQVRTVEGDVFGPYHLIEYPDWVTVVALAEDFRLLLVREYRHGIGAVSFGLPGGLMDPSDGPGRAGAETAVRRELREDTGHGGDTLERLTTLHSNPSNQTKGSRLSRFLSGQGPRCPTAARHVQAIANAAVGG